MKPIEQPKKSRHEAGHGVDARLQMCKPIHLPRADHDRSREREPDRAGEQIGER